MNKAILISIRPRYVADILKGIKTLEIRKTCPKCDLPIDVYIYCTKNGEVFKNANGQYHSYKNRSKCVYKGRLSNGVVVAKFTLNEIKDIYVIHFPYEYFYKATDLTKEQLEEKSCLGQIDLDQYLRKKKGYAWVINNLEIFNEPKTLQPFFDLDRPPQSYCFIEV